MGVCVISDFTGRGEARPLLGEGIQGNVQSPVGKARETRNSEVLYWSHKHGSPSRTDRLMEFLKLF